MENFTSDPETHRDQPADNRSPSRRACDAVFSALNKGAEDARKAAEEALPRIKAAASEAAYWTAYGTAFAAVFQWTLVKHLTPETVKSGCRDGVKAGKDAAEKWSAPKTHDTPPLIAQINPTGPQPN